MHLRPELLSISPQDARSLIRALDSASVAGRLCFNNPYIWTLENGMLHSDESLQYGVTLSRVSANDNECTATEHNEYVMLNDPEVMGWTLNPEGRACVDPWNYAPPTACRSELTVIHATDTENVNAASHSGELDTRIKRTYRLNSESYRNASVKLGQISRRFRSSTALIWITSWLSI